jgi:hypothetical protein
VDRLKRIWYESDTRYRVTSVSVHSLTGEQHQNGFDAEAVQFLRDWGFQKPQDDKSEGYWRLFERAVTGVPGRTFLVKHASPNYNLPHIPLCIKKWEEKKRFCARPGYFCLTCRNDSTGHETLVDLGYAMDLRYDSLSGAYRFSALGIVLATWEVWCEPHLAI